MRKCLIVILSFLVTLLLPMQASANGGIHMGDTHIDLPPFVLWISGGFLALVFLMLLIGGIMSRKSLEQQELGATKEKEEEQHGTK